MCDYEIITILFFLFSSKLLLHVVQNTVSRGLNNWTRVIWCPFMPDEDYEADGIDNAKMLVFLNGSKVSTNIP